MLSKIFIFAGLLCAAFALEQYSVGKAQFSKTKNCIMFAGSKCSFSEQIEPELEKAELECGEGWTFWRTNCDKDGNNELCHLWGVHSFPQIGALIDGKRVNIMDGKRGKWQDICKYIRSIS